MTFININKLVACALVLLSMALWSLTAQAKNVKSSLATIEVKHKKNVSSLEQVVSIDLSAITDAPKDQLMLVAFVKQKNGKIKPVIQDFQIQNGETRRLVWLAATGKNAPTKFELRSVDVIKKIPVNVKAGFHSVSKNGLLTLKYQDRPLVGYQFGLMPAPEGVDASYGRSAFIHPLWSPKGQVLTRVQPDDHYHHYGIWNPWTHLSFQGREVDLWNLAKKQGTVEFGGWTSRAEGNVFTEIQALHKHVVFSEDGTKKTTAMNELQTLRIYRPQDDYYIMDMIIQLSAAGDDPVRLLEYRYGGFGWRATEQWHKGNSEVLSSGGQTRKDVDNTSGRWFYVQGEVDDDYAGAVIMSHTGNFNHPEPMRIWPIPDDARGDVFASFSPTKDRDWLIEPGKTYFQKYRFIVYNGKFNAKKADAAWREYVHSADVKVVVTD